MYRAFSCDVMLSSNMVASIATAINIHLWKHLYIIGHNGFSMNSSIRGSSAWWSRTGMVRVTALDIQVSLRNPTAMLEGSMTSVNTLYTKNNVTLKSTSTPGLWPNVIELLSNAHYVLSCTVIKTYGMVFVSVLHLMAIRLRSQDEPFDRNSLRAFGDR